MSTRERDQRGSRPYPWLDRTPFIGPEAPHLQVQSILYNNEKETLRRSVESLVRAAEISMAQSSTLRAVTLAIGDSSSLRCLSVIVPAPGVRGGRCRSRIW